MFPAGGLGTRFLPATKSLPKEMLPISNTPLMHYGVAEAFEAGLTKIGIVSGKSKKSIADYFDKNVIVEQSVKGTNKERLLDGINFLIKNCKFYYTRQKEAKGLGDAILTGEILIGKEPFGVILADDLCVNQGPGVMQQMIKVYKKYKCSIVAVEEVEPKDVSNYGVIAGEQITPDVYRVNEMVEKPSEDQAPSNLAIIGRYILTPDIFDIIRTTPEGKGGEIQITDALLTQAKQGNVIAYKFQGRRFDCGSTRGYMDANNYFFNLAQNASKS